MQLREKETASTLCAWRPANEGLACLHRGTPLPNSCSHGLSLARLPRYSLKVSQGHAARHARGPLNCPPESLAHGAHALFQYLCVCVRDATLQYMDGRQPSNTRQQLVSRPDARLIYPHDGRHRHTWMHTAIIFDDHKPAVLSAPFVYFRRQHEEKT